MTEEINKIPYWLVGHYQAESYTDTLDLHNEKSLYDICVKENSTMREIQLNLEIFNESDNILESITV